MSNSKSDDVLRENMISALLSSSIMYAESPPGTRGGYGGMVGGAEGGRGGLEGGGGGAS